LPHVIYSATGRELICAEWVGASVGVRTSARRHDLATITPDEARELARALLALADEADEST
jgi:hypothetical protein